MSLSVRYRIWPHLNDNIALKILGNGKQLKGFVSDDEMKNLSEIKSKFETQLPNFFPVSQNNIIVFEKVAKYLNNKDISRLVLIFDEIWPKGRSWISNRIKKSIENYIEDIFREFGPFSNNNEHWKKWTKSNNKERLKLFEEFGEFEAKEIWNSGLLIQKKKYGRIYQSISV
jgi:hypothetical protein